MDRLLQCKTERRRLLACAGRAVQAPLPKTHFLLMKVAGWQLQQVPSPHGEPGSHTRHSQRPRDILLCWELTRSPGTVASLPASSLPRRHEAMQSRTCPACASSPTGTSAVLIRNNRGSRGSWGCWQRHGARRRLSFRNGAAFLPSSSPISSR